MDWFQQQFEKSNIISGFLAVVIWSAIIYLAITGQKVPEILYFGGSTVVGFFFGAKSESAQHGAVMETITRMTERRFYDDDVYSDG